MAAAATSTAIPEATTPKTAQTVVETTKAADATETTTAKSPFPLPKLRLEIRNASHDGADVFLGRINAAAVLAKAVADVQRLLYALDSNKTAAASGVKADPHTHMPPTRSVTVILRDMDGVAYTTGSDLDSDHKEIHFSLGYIAGIKPRDVRAAPEIAGVLTHELVHCYQWNGLGSAPGGLIEGIADWVRLHAALSPPHWRREPTAAGRWDAGYQHTGYFLDYLEQRFGSGTVRRINEKLRLHRYSEKPFWTELLGAPVGQLWADYVQSVEGSRSA